ncbi:DUF968 domain-containing protein [Serratia sp. JSRIV006]|uniref:DUF968 domain-containing protein n=1 Tax=Serratia sp. JSRIV006 TaxID=2831896 RepID=UPI001CBB78AA|nr:DUF968 domain-containing protein [Serratia sp. JSRIV006]
MIAKKLKIDDEPPKSHMLIPKLVRQEDSKYIKWVKTRPCSGCGGSSDDPHHVIGHGQGGTGTKAHDLFAIPMCRRCHTKLHEDPKAWEEEHGSQVVILFRFLDYSIGIGAIA